MTLQKSNNVRIVLNCGNVVRSTRIPSWEKIESQLSTIMGRVARKLTPCANPKKRLDLRLSTSKQPNEPQPVKEKI